MPNGCDNKAVVVSGGGDGEPVGRGAGRAGRRDGRDEEGGGAGGGGDGEADGRGDGGDAGGGGAGGADTQPRRATGDARSDRGGEQEKVYKHIRGGTIHRCIDISRYFSRDTYRDIIFYNRDFFF